MVETRQQRRARERAEAKAARAQEAAGQKELDLVDGLPVTPNTRIRLATPGDVDKVATLVQLADVELEDDLLEGLRSDGGVAGALRAGLRSGQEALMAEIATASAKVKDPREIYLRSLLPLVADRDGEILGALVAYPPVNVIHRYYTHAAVYGPREQQKVLLGGAIALTRLKAVAVAEDARGGGLGAALVKRCMQVYRACGFLLVYGQIPADRDLDSFYSSLGFDVGEADGELDLWPIFGYPGGVHADRGERLFARWL